MPGGKRTGAGRKAPEGVKQSLTVRLKPARRAQLERLQAELRANASEVVDRALELYAASHALSSET